MSLWDMVIVLAAEFGKIWPSLNELQMGFEMGGEDAPDNNEIHETLGHLYRFANSIGWRDLAKQTDRLMKRCAAGERGAPMEALARDLQQAFEEKTHDIKLVLVPEEDSILLEDATTHLCGTSLVSELAISEEELNLSGRSLALGLSTASVSHAMRSVEASLYVVARTLGITFPGGVELQDWLPLTEKIQKEIDAWESRSRSPEKSEQLKLFAKLVLPADAFRLAWRNHVAHAREKYEADEAKRVLRNVADFLKSLSLGCGL
jgi:hypothetical protein